MGAGFCVQHLPKFLQQWMMLKIGFSIFKIKGIIKIRRILSLVVLQDRFGFIESLDKLCLRSLVGIVFFPESQERLRLFFGKQGEKLFDILLLRSVFCVFICILGGGNIAHIALAQIVNETHHQYFFGVYVKGWSQKPCQKSQPPGMLCRAFRAAGSSPCLTQDGFEPFSFLNKGNLFFLVCP